MFPIRWGLPLPREWHVVLQPGLPVSRACMRSRSKYIYILACRKMNRDLLEGILQFLKSRSQRIEKNLNIKSPRNLDYRADVSALLRDKTARESRL
jgi:hypothetical protein